MTPPVASSKAQAELDAAAWEQAWKNRRLVYSVIDEKFHWLFNTDKSQLMSREDYFQEGLIGLFTAAKKYDPKRGEFSTYAWPWIFQAISRAHRAKHFKGARVAYGVYEAISKIKKEHPEDYEMWIPKCGRQNVIDGYNALNKVYSLDNPLIPGAHHENNYEDHAMMAECVAEAPNMHDHDRTFLMTMIRAAAKSLTAIEKQILFSKFGIDCPVLFTREIAKIMKITKREVDEHEKQALQKVKKFFTVKNKNLRELIVN